MGTWKSPQKVIKRVKKQWLAWHNSLNTYFDDKKCLLDFKTLVIAINLLDWVWVDKPSLKTNDLETLSSKQIQLWGVSAFFLALTDALSQ